VAVLLKVEFAVPLNDLDIVRVVVGVMLLDGVMDGVCDALLV